MQEGIMNVRNILTIIATLMTLSSVTFADTTVTNSAIGISAYLPDNWVSVTSGDSSISFYDSTFAYRSQIVVNRHVIPAADYAAAGDWTRSHILAYLLVVQYSYDPFGAVLYFDTSATARQDSLWSPEAFSEYYSLDTALDSWNEYMRYTESGSNGYELYAIGDTTDMKTNIGLYMAIMRMIKIDHTTEISAASVHRPTLHTTLTITRSVPVSPGVFDLLGKKQRVYNRIHSGIYYRVETGAMELNVR